MIQFLSEVLFTTFQVWIESVSIARPLVPDKDITANERKVFPSEVSLDHR